MKQAEDEQVAKRIWRHDPTLWKAEPEHEKIIRNSLGWLTVANEMIGVTDELTEFAAFRRSRGFRHVMVCGMGGSSLCPEVLAQTFGRQEGFPELLVLDSTDPDVIERLLRRIDLETCLFVISSKSGTTTEPTVFYKFWYDQVGHKLQRPGENFLAITDPGSPLVQTANELGFQWVFLNQADIGGRYSALSYFGMVPAALMGIDLKRFLGRAKEASQSCASVMPAQNNPGLQLGVVMGECANQGRNKLTLVLDRPLSSLGLWIEQLVAESTGKEGKGILPVAGEDLGDPTSYSDDRVFVSITLGPPSKYVKAKLDALESAGHPVVYRQLANVYDLGAEFFVWEFATAVAGWRLGINPFDQPNVQESKDVTKELLAEFVEAGRLPDQEQLAADGLLTAFTEGNRNQNLRADSLVSAVRTLLSSLTTNDYVAFLNYIEETLETEASLQSLRLLVRDAKRCATTTGYGPRFLHSTGQLHKGGPDAGVFVQITAPDKTDFAVPGEPYTFSVLKQAQATGDFRALAARGRRAIRIDLGPNAESAFRSLHRVFETALQNVNTTSQ
jgi:glucose-6-phosphate isomerase